MDRPGSTSASGASLPRRLAASAVALVVVSAAGPALADEDGPTRRDRKPAPDAAPITFEARTLDGSGNNKANPTWGEAGTPYLRLAAPAYADGVAEMVSSPDPRFVSNRVFNDAGQNIFSSRDLSQWVWVWGQFLDHTFGLRETASGEAVPLTFDPNDPLEDFPNELGAIAFERTPAAPGTGDAEPREQVNTLSSYIDAAAVYGVSADRLEWLREGAVNGDLSDNAATLMLPGGYLPTTTARGDAASAPTTELQGRLAAAPDAAVVAGDVRANENIALTAIQTLFAREHNRIVDLLPSGFDEQLKFEIARRVVGAEQQFITYTEFLPAVGVELPSYEGYDPSVDASLSNEFAAVAYRMHSMIHGEFEIEVEAGFYGSDELGRLEAQGVEVDVSDDAVALTVPLHLAFGNPSLVRDIGLGPLLASLGGEGQYANDEQIDNQLRSVLFQVPSPDAADPEACFGDEAVPECFSGVLDLGAIDIQRGRDHGIPTYNDLRVALGLAPLHSFPAVTGESAAALTDDPEIDPDDPINDPDLLDVVTLLDADGNRLEPGSDAASEEAVIAERRTTLAARLEAIYGSVDELDAFVGMVAEPHEEGSELGELQLAIWRDQFQRLRDGDRFFYRNDPALAEIERRYGISYRHTLSELITANAEDAEVAPNVFVVADAEAQPRDVTPPDHPPERRPHDRGRGCEGWLGRRPYGSRFDT